VNISFLFFVYICIKNCTTTLYFKILLVFLFLFIALLQLLSPETHIKEMSAITDYDRLAAFQVRRSLKSFVFIMTFYFYFLSQNCNPNFEVCCTIEAPQTPRPVAPSTYRPTQPPQTYRPTQPPQTYRPTQRPTPPPQTQRPYYDTTPQYLPPATNRPTPRPTQPRPTQPRPTQPRPTQPRPTAPPARPCPVNGNACVSPQLCRSGTITSSAVPRGSFSVSTYPIPIHTYISSHHLRYHIEGLG
jgi:hypothetical protein